MDSIPDHAPHVLPGTVTLANIAGNHVILRIAPHRYVVGRRVEAARKLLLAGVPIAQTAAEVGFHDQAHFTKQFRRHVGATPGRFAHPLAK